ncbi:MAG: FMN-binding protein [Patescibacteria group bacterium]|nr:FMN-binding protein [Patescibacteria group bacterium]
MKKYLVSLAVILLFVFYVALNKQNSATIASPLSTGGSSSGAAVTTTVPAGSTPNQNAIGGGISENNGENESGDDGAPVQNTPVASKPTVPPAPKPAPSPASTGLYKNGNYIGPVTDAFYGNLQVVAVVQGGKLADVQFPVYPSDSGHSLEVSQIALPQLRQEAIQSQSANVNIVSGATQTSQAFQQSLAAALAQAK